MTQWINERTNKDNFWNLMFWVIISSARMLSTVVDIDDPLLRLILFVLGPIIFSVCLVKTQAKVTFDKERFFLNSRDEPIFERCPNIFLWVFITFALSVSLDVYIGFTYRYGASLSKYISFSTYLLAFVLLFIQKNCPISILFNKKFWELSMEFEIQKNADGSTSLIKKQHPLHLGWRIKIRNQNSSNTDI